MSDRSQDVGSGNISLVTSRKGSVNEMNKESNKWPSADGQYRDRRKGQYKLEIRLLILVLYQINACQQLNPNVN